MGVKKGSISYNIERMPLQQNDLIYDREFLNIVENASKDFNYATSHASIACPFDITMHKQVHEHAAKIGPLDYCVVIGIGGSSLGFRAVYEALQDTATIPSDRVLFLETIDAPAVKQAYTILDSALKNGARVHVCVISKSGTTLETVTLWQIIQPLLAMRKPKDWYTHVTIITDENSPLAAYAQTHNITCMKIPKLVGGRYSVCSPVGLMPLSMCGIDINSFCAGARDAVTMLCTGQNSMPFNHASALVWAYTHNYHVHDTFIFSTWCAALGQWYRQLAAESLGKADARGTIFSMIPTVSIGSTDLHSIGQLYFSGARNFWTTIILLNEKKFSSNKLTEIMHALAHATLQTYQDLAIPFSVLELPERSAYTIGFVMQSYMLAIMQAGKHLELNPFNQPNVERYKILAHAQLDAYPS